MRISDVFGTKVIYVSFRCKIKILLTQKVHLAPNTQQAEQAGFARAKSNDDVPVNFS
jgi:hypothetical protein